MDRSELVYQIIRKNVVNRMFEYVDDSDYIDDVVDYIIDVTHMTELIEALKEISLSKMWDTDIAFAEAPQYWREKTKHIQDIAEDALLLLYKRDSDG